MRWEKTIKIKHLFTDGEDHESVQKVMNNVADVLSGIPEFAGLPFDRFRNIPSDNEWCTPVDAANQLLNYVYDIADSERIWIE